MNKLIKIEMERAFKNKMLIISVVIGLVIVGFNIWNEIIPARKTLDKLLEMGKYSGIQLPGLYMKWMGVRPGAYVFLYYFIMPLLTALPFCPVYSRWFCGKLPACYIICCDSYDFASF